MEMPQRLEAELRSKLTLSSTSKTAGGINVTALREAHRISGSDTQQVKTGDIGLIHDDTPRVNWRMAVIESVNKGRDGIIRSADICTTTGKTNRPITRLYTLELTVA